VKGGFDDFYIDGAAAGEKPAGRSPMRGGKPKFAMFPMSLARTLSGSGEAAILLTLCLIHQDWKTKGEAFTLSNVMAEEWGLTRLQKHRALGKLEALGLVQIQRGGKASPRVKWAPPVSQANR
jgi:hypothetical protein